MDKEMYKENHILLDSCCGHEIRKRKTNLFYVILIILCNNPIYSFLARQFQSDAGALILQSLILGSRALPAASGGSFRYVYKLRSISMIKIFPHFPSSDDMPSVPLILTILISKNAFSGAYCKSQVKTRRSVVFSMVWFGKFNESSSIVTAD